MPGAQRAAGRFARGHAFKQVLPVPEQVPERLSQEVHEGYEWLYRENYMIVVYDPATPA